MEDNLTNKFEDKLNKSKYKVLTWKNPTMLHWIINPGLAFNELILGQRIPKVILVEKNSDKTLGEKAFIPCPHCETLHSSLKWSSQNKTAFKNWFGYYCDNCRKIIPCLMNLTSYLILGLTLPFWYFFKDNWKAKWLNEQRTKFSQPMLLSPPKFQWWLAGLKFGALSFVLTTIVSSLVFGRKLFLDDFLIDIFMWTIGGLMWGLFMKLVVDTKVKS